MLRNCVDYEVAAYLPSDRSTSVLLDFHHVVIEVESSSFFSVPKYNMIFHCILKFQFVFAG